MISRSLAASILSIFLTLQFPFVAFAQAGRCESVFAGSSGEYQGLSPKEVDGLLIRSRHQEALWLARQIGDLQFADQIKTKMLNTFSRGKLSHFERMDVRSASEVFTVIFEDGTKAIFKPDPMYWTEKEAVNAVLADSRADFMASRFDEVLGLNFVPLSIKSEIQGMTGSIQAFVDMNVRLEYTHSELQNPEIRSKEYEMKDVFIQKNSEVLKLFDYLIYNMDRHSGNSGRWLSYTRFPDRMLPGEGSGIVAFDNSASFQRELSAEGHYRPISPEGLKISRDKVGPFLKALQEKLTPEIIQKEMKSTYRQNIIDEVIQRRAEILSYYSLSP